MPRGLTGSEAHLRSLRENQERRLQHARRVRRQLDSIARGIRALAQQGDEGAAATADQLARRSITINPDFPGMAGAPK
jgi:hypothetical protein